MRKKVLQYFLAIPPWTKLIRDLNPIFWIEDMTVVVDGKLVDKSGNGKQIVVDTTTLTNDSIIMPASDSEIIAKLTEIGIYTMFYTDDTHPKKVLISVIPFCHNLYLFSKNGVSHFVLSNLPKTEALFTKFGEVNYNNLQNVNLVKQNNFFVQSLTSPLEEGVDYVTKLSSSYVGTDLRVENNAYAFSVNKKTIINPIPTAGGQDTILKLEALNQIYGKVTIGFWLNKTVLGGKALGLTYFNGDAAPDISETIVVGWVDSMVLNHEETTGTYITNVKIIAVSGDWCYIQTKINVGRYGTNYKEGWTFYAILNWGAPNLTYDCEIVDLVVINADVNLNPATDYPGLYGLNTTYLGKKLCSIGDSISEGMYSSIVANKLGMTNHVNYAKSGSGMVYKGTDANWIPFYKAGHVAAAADVYLIMAGVNDAGSTIGNEGSVDDTEFTGAYDNYISYLTTELPTALIVLITPPPTSDPAVESVYATMASRIKYVGNKYGCAVCDLKTLTSLTYNNAYINLADGTHWGLNAHRANGNVVAKYLKEL